MPTTQPPPAEIGVSVDYDEAFEIALAQKTYKWLDEQFADRDEKDVETLEVAATMRVG